MARVVLDKVRKSYGHVETVHGIDLDIGDAEFIVLVGPSGCGKSTTLRMIAGLETISGGEIRIDDRRVNDLQPGERDVAMVFQNYALYPHLSVADNITFGLKLRKTPRDEIRRRLQTTAEVLEIASLLNRKPRQLSGGQRQRVAMGRAIIRNPSVFLFDEPLSNLDAKLRVQMRTEIKQLHARIPTTTVYVTHDQVEAMTLADRVVVMNDGRIEQIAAPQELYLNPATKFVAGFIGAPGTNFASGSLRRDSDRLLARIGEWSLELPSSMSDACLGHLDREVTVGIRPEHFAIASDDAKGNVVKAKVNVVEPLGMETLVHFRLAQTAMVARLPPDPRIAVNAVLSLDVDVDRIHLFDPQSNVLIC
jgi:multiple sugar transport system ATP-binding protein